MKTSNRSEITRDSVAREIRVLVLGSCQTALTHDAFLSLYKHKVTTTSKATAGLSMILNGGAYDCVFVVTDEYDMNLNYFVHQSSKLLPDLKIILLAPNDMPKEVIELALYYKAVWLRVKPCGLEGISNVFEQIINRKMELLKIETDFRSNKRKKYSNFPNRSEGWNQRGKEKAYPYTILEQMNVPSLSRNDIASHPQFQVDIERGRLMREPVIQKTNHNLNMQNYTGQRLGLSAPSHYDASTFQSNSLLRQSNLNSIGSSLCPVLTAATCGSQAPDHSYINLLRQDLGETSRSIALGLDENPPMDMAQGSQVELQDQDYRKEVDTMVTGENYSLPDFGEVMAPLDVDATVESQYNLGADASCVSNVSNFSNNSNSGGACGFSEAIPKLDVGATLRSQYNPGVVANIFSNGFDNSYSGGGSGSEIVGAPRTSVVGANYVTSHYNLGVNGNLFSNSFGNSNSGGASGSGISEAPATSVVGENVESQYSIGANANVYSTGFDNSNSGGASGSGLSKQLANVDGFGIQIEPHTTATDGVPSTSNGGLEHLALPLLNSSDLGGDFHPQENVDNSQTLRLPVSAVEEKYGNKSWLSNLLETDSIISMGNYNANNDFFSYEP